MSVTETHPFSISGCDEGFGFFAAPRVPAITAVTVASRSAVLVVMAVTLWAGTGNSQAVEVPVRACSSTREAKVVTGILQLRTPSPEPRAMYSVSVRNQAAPLCRDGEESPRDPPRRFRQPLGVSEYPGFRAY